MKKNYKKKKKKTQKKKKKKIKIKRKIGKLDEDKENNYCQPSGRIRYLFSEQGGKKNQQNFKLSLFQKLM